MTIKKNFFINNRFGQPVAPVLNANRFQPVETEWSENRLEPVPKPVWYIRFQPLLQILRKVRLC